MKFSPDILTLKDGTQADTPEKFALRRAEMLDILAREEYGYIPEFKGEVSAQVIKSSDDRICAGHGSLEEITVSFDAEKGRFSFPLKLIMPVGVKNPPLFLLINFRQEIYDKYIPLEEIIDRGFAVAVIYYQDITSDDGDMANGLAGLYTRPTDGTGFGKISLWAFALSRAADYLFTRDDFDKENVAVIGHSRLGKTALWCGANDSRFAYVLSNCSGCGGAAYEKGKRPEAETIEHMNKVFPFWFCENRQKYAGREDEMPFDQHFLIGASAGRRVLVESATEDLWADPQAEERSCMGAKPAFDIAGGEAVHHIRHGKHFLSRNDWNFYMDYISRTINSGGTDNEKQY